MASVQFKGIDSVIEAYERRRVPAWSLWQGSQFMFKYEGNDIAEGAQELSAILEALGESTNAVYTLKVYEDHPGKIKDKTPHDGSFNFKINGGEQEVTNSQYGALRNQSAILEKLERLEQRLNEREDEEEERPNKLGLIGEILNDPGTSSIVVPLIMKAFGISGISTPQPTRMAISGINDDAAATLKEAMTILQNADPKLPEHLMKLARLSQQSPDSFNFLLKTLDGM